MPEVTPLIDAIEADLYVWMREFVAVKNDFYGAKFPPCPFASGALAAKTVDVIAWPSGDVCAFIRHQAVDMGRSPFLTTRVLAFPPRVQFAWGISDYIESLNAQLIPLNLFLNTGVAKTTTSRYMGSRGLPYFVVVANSLDAVLQGAEALLRTGYYNDWPASHFELVVKRRTRLAKRYGVDPGVGGRT